MVIYITWHGSVPKFRTIQTAMCMSFRDFSNCFSWEIIKINGFLASLLFVPKKFSCQRFLCSRHSWNHFSFSVSKISPAWIEESDFEMSLINKSICVIQKGSGPNDPIYIRNTSYWRSSTGRWNMSAFSFWLNNQNDLKRVTFIFRRKEKGIYTSSD